MTPVLILEILAVLMVANTLGSIAFNWLEDKVAIWADVKALTALLRAVIFAALKPAKAVVFKLVILVLLNSVPILSVCKAFKIAVFKTAPILQV